MELVGSALDVLKVIAKRARNGLFDGVGFLCHIGFLRYFACDPPPWHFRS